LHTSLQVVPAAHVSDFAPLHVKVQLVVPPQMTLQIESPWQRALQPPVGQLMSHVVVPSHVSVELCPREIVAVAPPDTVTVLFVPVVRSQVLAPVHWDVQFEPQLPVHVDWLEHWVVHPVPQLTLHELVWQL
jgi:hypothetical protein